MWVRRGNTGAMWVIRVSLPDLCALLASRETPAITAVKNFSIVPKDSISSDRR
jgi:hypothetical protein